MSKARLVITAVITEKRPVAEVARDYQVARSWLYELLARYRAEGDAAFEPRSRRPKASPLATPPSQVDLVLRLRKELSEAGLDAGADTIGWHLTHRHDTVLSRATINRILTRARAVVPEPAKRPRSSYIRFEASQPNETWQSDFTLSRANTPGVGRPVRMIMRLAGTRGSVPRGPPVDGPERPGRSPDPGHGWAGVVRALDVAGDH